MRHHCQRQLSCQNRQFQRLLPSGRDCVPSYVPAVIQRILQSIEYRRYIGNNQLDSESKDEDYQKLEEAYRVYRKIGGYPQVVTTFIESGEINDCVVVLEELIRTFTAESSRFFANSTALSIFQEAYKAVLVQIAEEKKGTGKTFRNLSRTL